MAHTKDGINRMVTMVHRRHRQLLRMTIKDEKIPMDTFRIHEDLL